MGNRIQKEKQLVCIADVLFLNGMNERGFVVVGIVGKSSSAPLRYCLRFNISERIIFIIIIPVTVQKPCGCLAIIFSYISLSDNLSESPAYMPSGAA